MVYRCQQRISGQRLDRIDIHLDVPRVAYADLTTLQKDEPSIAIRLRGVAARGYHRILNLARTIADLAGVEVIAMAHLAEALQHRPKVVNTWLLSAIQGTTHRSALSGPPLRSLGEYP